MMLKGVCVFVYFLNNIKNNNNKKPVPMGDSNDIWLT